MSSTHPAGLLLAAGAGRRMGVAKALVRTASGEPWLHRAVRALREGGCGPVVVTLGAAAAQASEVLDELELPEVRVVEVPDWEAGMSRSLRAGLRHLDTTGASLTAVSLVDLPDVGGAVVARLLDVAAAAPTTREVLARATYRSVPGHPVLIGAAHVSAILAHSSGDRGARDYLAGQEVVSIECGDLATGADVDTPPTGR